MGFPISGRLFVIMPEAIPCVAPYSSCGEEGKEAFTFPRLVSFPMSRLKACFPASPFKALPGSDEKYLPIENNVLTLFYLER
jgi:hypothetical protein